MKTLSISIVSASKPVRYYLTGFFVMASLCVFSQAPSVHGEGLSLPPLREEYKKITMLDPDPRPVYAKLDSISFPIEKMNKGFYRALKLRSVYLDVPVSEFTLPPFPANSSEQTRAELDYLLKLQKQRTPKMIEAARNIAAVSFNPFVHPSDSNYPYYRNNLFHIGHSMGEWFNEKNLPKTADLIANVWQDQLHYMWSFKFQFNRARPVQLESRIDNLEPTNWPAYPSGHATFAYTNAFLLQELFPQFKDVIYKDAYECAHSREILGVHFPSDSEAGRILARQLINEMLKKEKFVADLKAAKQEVDKLLANIK
jgi:acid phosphatase (class A)